MSVKVITGYVPIPNHPRSAEVYGKLGENFRDIRARVKPFYMPLDRCWMTKFLWEQPKYTHSTGDNPEKNSVAYHCVNHQKTEWLSQAAEEDPEPDVFVWIDYGIFRLPGVTADVINDFLARVEGERRIVIPGCWTQDETKGRIVDDYPCWRFCGSVLICPREHVHDLDDAVQIAARGYVWRTNHVTWEVNTWARMEKHCKLPIRWYKADHNETMFTNYRSEV